MKKTPEQIEAAVKNLIVQNSAIELSLCAMASLLTADQMRLLRDRMAALGAIQEIADGERSTAMAQDLLQPALDRLHAMLAGANRQFQDRA
ncbi:MAG: hypothetical protein ACK5QH_08885 [Rubrivivax sp.]